MAAAGEKRTASRSRSPEPPATNGESVWPKDSSVQFFHAADPQHNHASYICPTRAPGRGPRLLQSHGWITGKLVEDYVPENFDKADRNTWPIVAPGQDVLFANRSGGKLGQAAGPRRVHGHHLRKLSSAVPLLSVVFVRWNSEDAVAGPRAEEEANDGDWGNYGCPPSDTYMSALVSKGLMAHPELKGDDKLRFRFELFSLFVKSSADVEAIGGMAHWLAGVLNGQKRATFWMLWPAEWEDARGSDYAAYIDRRAFFGAMRSCESVGIRTGWPHPADQYEQITSKTWMATLCLHPLARLPAATIVNKGNVLSDAKRTAQKALAALEYIRHQNPFPLAGHSGEPPAPSVINKDGVKKGVVKLGWSWEARFVAIFNGEEDLAVKLKEMLDQPGCVASACVVQEWVDFDFEMRQYFLPPDNWTPTTRLLPTRIECNAWSGSMENGERRNFHKLNRTSVLESYWDKDEKAWESAKEQATTIAQFLLGWLLLNDAQPLPMIRLDFMLHRTGPGQARVVFGEYCEMGACCLGWEEGPPTIWRAALDAALR